MPTEIQQAEMRNRYPQARCHRSRIAAVVDACQGKRVIHIGCVDAGFYDTHRTGDRLLHERIFRVATTVVGVDVDADGIERMRRDGYSRLVVADITAAAGRDAVMNAASGDPIDVIVCGETIEHVPDPVQFMAGVLELGRATTAQAIITTPNPFYLGNFVNALRGVEVVHPDHNVYLSGTNLLTIIRKAGGARDVRVDFYSNLSPNRWKAGLKRAITVTFPMLADGLLLTVQA